MANTHEEFEIQKLQTTERPLDILSVNNTIRASIKGHGDHGDKPRDVRYYIYKGTCRNKPIRSKYIKKYMQGLGLNVVPTVSNPGLVLFHDREVASKDFDTFTHHIADYVTERGWIYDHWECRVMVPQFPSKMFH